MNARTLLDNFDLIADAPGGVPKLRELILQLAVRGKLVPQDPKDESAQVTGSDDTTETEPKYAIPAQWIWTQLGCVIDYNYGGKTESERIPADAWLLDLEDIEKDTSRLLQRVLAGDRKSTSTKSQFSAGDVLYGKLRPYLNKVLVANSDGYCTTEIVPMKPLKGVNPHYVVCVLKSRDFLDYTAARSYGMKMPRLGTEDTKRAPFPLPPLPEQKRIVAKVDELMKRCDELEARQKKRATHHKTLVASCLNAVTDPQKPNPNFIIHNSSFNILFTSPESIAELRKTILQLAVQGRLVSQDSGDESAALLSESADEFVAQSSFEIPQGWTWSRLSHLADINGGFAFKSTAYTDKGTRVVRISDFDEFGFKEHKVVRHPFTTDLRKFALEENNILMAMTGGTVGKSYFVKSLPEPMVVNQRVATINVLAHVSPSYIDIVIRSELTQEVIRKVKNSTNDNISMGDIKGFAIPLPPLAEQKRIVAKVNELMAMSDKLEAKLTQSSVVSEKLAEAVVAQSAKG